MKDKIRAIEKMLEDANKSSDKAAAGYDEGYYNGKVEAFEEVVALFKINTVEAVKLPKQMTIEQLYLYAKEKGIEKCKAEIQYADGGGIYHGTRDIDLDDIVIKEEGTQKTVVL